MNAHASNAKPLAAIIGGVAVTAAALIGGVLQSASDAGPVAGDMSTGVTVTATKAPSEAPIPAAAPEIKGPAPLPAEEQGLPG